MLTNILGQLKGKSLSLSHFNIIQHWAAIVFQHSQAFSVFIDNIYFLLLLFSFVVVVLAAFIAKRPVQFIITITCTSKEPKSTYVKSSPLGLYYSWIEGKKVIHFEVPSGDEVILYSCLATCRGRGLCSLMWIYLDWENSLRFCER